MARYRGAVCRLCRRERIKLNLKGERCLTDKCALERRAYPPGQHGQGRGKASEYGRQLREKQKVRRIYGIQEKQFRAYFKEADRLKGVTGENLLLLLERRLDNMIYRMGYAASRSEARQLVRHGHFTVNGRRVDIPSYSTRQGDIIAVREKSKKVPAIVGAYEAASAKGIPGWLEVDAKAFSGTIKEMPKREDITMPIEEHLIVELYSK
ncbi:MAG: 30S ribosomal protein S4 [Deltaproteobacteria bacterium]|nr:MAG: 30S ribosomal protein S4 [Deltaproteobacteria bacterium]PLX45669.1 MAG: 30S ribosomal protein S4 [Deltaproteobacteria bacterium]